MPILKLLAFLTTSLLLLLISNCTFIRKHRKKETLHEAQTFYYYQRRRTAPAIYPSQCSSRTPTPQNHPSPSLSSSTSPKQKVPAPPFVFTDQTLQQMLPSSAPAHQHYNWLPPLIRSQMPLSSWLYHLPYKISPRLPHCRSKIIARAREDLGKRSFRCAHYRTPIPYRNDCSGWVRCVYHSLFGLDLFVLAAVHGNSGTYLLYHYMATHQLVHRGIPAPGDLVFWNATTDRNHNGRLDDDPLTHVGLVDTVDDDGRIQILHTGLHSHPGVHRAYMYLLAPSLHKDPHSHRILNSFLVSSKKHNILYGRTTGELFAGFGSLRSCP